MSWVERGRGRTQVNILWDEEPVTISHWNRAEQFLMGTSNFGF